MFFYYFIQYQLFIIVSISCVTSKCNKIAKMQS